MVYIVCPPLTMMTSMINNEITRLESLMESSKDLYETKQSMSKMFMLCKLVSPEQEKKIEAHTKQFQATKVLMDLKISFWKQYLTKKVRPTMLEELNAGLTEWLEASWEYFGQENIKEDSENAKDEYKMFKQMFEMCEKKEKKTRRGGKKHRK